MACWACVRMRCGSIIACVMHHLFWPAHLCEGHLCAAEAVIEGHPVAPRDSEVLHFKEASLCVLLARGAEDRVGVAAEEKGKGDNQE